MWPWTKHSAHCLIKVYIILLSVTSKALYLYSEHRQAGGQTTQANTWYTLLADSYINTGVASCSRHLNNWTAITGIIENSNKVWQTTTHKDKLS